MYYLNGEIYDSPEQNDTAWLGKLLDKYGISPLSDIDWHGAIAYLILKQTIYFFVVTSLVQNLYGGEWDKKSFRFSTSLKSFQQKESFDRTYWYMASIFW